MSPSFSNGLPELFPRHIPSFMLNQIELQRTGYTKHGQTSASLRCQKIVSLQSSQLPRGCISTTFQRSHRYIRTTAMLCSISRLLRTVGPGSSLMGLRYRILNQANSSRNNDEISTRWAATLLFVRIEEICDAHWPISWPVRTVHTVYCRLAEIKTARSDLGYPSKRRSTLGWDSRSPVGSIIHLGWLIIPGGGPQEGRHRRFEGITFLLHIPQAPS